MIRYLSSLLSTRQAPRVKPVAPPKPAEQPAKAQPQTMCQESLRCIPEMDTEPGWAFDADRNDYC